VVATAEPMIFTTTMSDPLAVDRQDRVCQSRCWRLRRRRYSQHPFDLRECRRPPCTWLRSAVSQIATGDYQRRCATSPLVTPLVSKNRFDNCARRVTS
jgi:hypothetical protein